MTGSGSPRDCRRPENEANVGGRCTELDADAVNGRSAPRVGALRDLDGDRRVLLDDQEAVSLLDDPLQLCSLVAWHDQKAPGIAAHALVRPERDGDSLDAGSVGALADEVAVLVPLEPVVQLFDTFVDGSEEGFVPACAPLPDAT